MLLNDLTTVSAEIFEIRRLEGAGSLTDRLAHRGYLRRTDVCRGKLGQPWLSTTALAVLARSPLANGFLAFTSTRSLLPITDEVWQHDEKPLRHNERQGSC